jgi:hypothetical protein
MKPQSQISRQPKRLRAEQALLRLLPKQPATDCSYHAAGVDMRAANKHPKLSPPAVAPSLRDLSNEFLGAETKRNYVAEVLFFAIIVAVSAWPIVSMVQALGQLLK